MQLMMRNIRLDNVPFDILNIFYSWLLLTTRTPQSLDIEIFKNNKIYSIYPTYISFGWKKRQKNLNYLQVFLQKIYSYQIKDKSSSLLKETKHFLPYLFIL